MGHTTLENHFFSDGPFVGSALQNALQSGPMRCLRHGRSASGASNQARPMRIPPKQEPGKGSGLTDRSRLRAPGAPLLEHTFR